MYYDGPVSPAGALAKFGGLVIVERALDLGFGV